MHSLFIGPYRQLNSNGLCSLTILHHLASKIPPNHTLSSRNVYIDSVNIDNKNTLCSKFDQLEHISVKPQVIIQHVPVNSIYVSNRMYNICIPIMDNSGIDVQHLMRLSACNKILADNHYTHEILRKLLPHNDIQYIDYKPILSDSNPQINLGAYNHTKKLYFIGSYMQNVDLLRDLILSFIIAMSDKNTISLLLFLTETTPKEIESLNNYIHTTYKQLNIANIFAKVVCIPTKLDFPQIESCHRAGDIYLNINDSSKNALNLNYAKHYNNNIIDWSNLAFEFKHTRNNMIYDKGFSVPLQSSLMSAMLQIDNMSSPSIQPTPIERVLWE